MFSIFRDFFGGRLLGVFDALQGALDFLQRNNTIDLGPDDGVRDDVTIDEYGVTLRADVDGADVTLSPIARLFRLAGEGDFTVQTAAVDTRVYGNDADNTYIGNTARDVLYGGDGVDTMDGRTGDDVLYGGGGNDILTTGTGRDRAYGGDGDDIIHAGTGQNRVYGGAGDDTYVVDTSAKNQLFIYDFDAGDVIDLGGLAGATSLDDLQAKGGRAYQSKDNVIVSYGDIQIQLRDFDLADLNADDFRFSNDGGGTGDGGGGDAGDLGYTPADDVDEIDIGGVTYKRRAEEPLHASYKLVDGNGVYWSPDYFVMVVGGQSNAEGSARDGEFIRSDDVVAYDWVNDELVLSAYDAAPAGGAARSGSTLKNNFYFPAATELAADLGQPVLVVAHAVPGSVISTWLESGTGENWANLNPEVTRALELVGQDTADAFLWHQGESDYPLPTATYKALALELVDQVRGTDWANDDLPFLFGELSKQGVNWAQNIALQEIELENTDPNIAVVSSAGLISDELSGVHFNGASLTEFAGRYVDVLQGILSGLVADPNTAPTPAIDAPVPDQITLAEGQELRLDVSDFFSDAEGDDLYYYSYLNKRNTYLYNTDQDTDELILTPSYDHAGNYTLFLYANDYDLDGDRIEIDLTITEATPLVTVFNNRNFDEAIRSYRDLETGLDALPRNRGLEILDQAAFSGGDPVTLVVDTQHIKGDASIRGDFVLSETAPRAYFYGEGRFNVQGDAADNYIWGSDGRNDLRGNDGADRLYGNGGDDVLRGDAGDDRLYGGDGDDRILVNRGNDQAYGGAGSDTFIFARGDEELYVRDFDATDVVQLNGFGFDDFADFEAGATIRQGNGRTIIEIGDDRVQLSDITPETLNEDQFVFV
ncbi:MAG: sialate O-acetylesterase [Yoonia sp.]|uniref:sialate O-acetylesterase n=1 Tax=Yoonia sp. TaxID=2212373 RepID=UPI003266C6EC